MVYVIGKLLFMESQSFFTGRLKCWNARSAHAGADPAAAMAIAHSGL